MQNISEIIQKEFPSKKIVIVGDLVADQFLRGTISRVSREAPVFILRHDETETLGGGAANAAVNVASLKGKAVAVGLVGKDENGRELLKALRREGVNCDYVVRTKRLKTTTKVRILAGQHYAQRQQVIRVDYENDNVLDGEIIEKLTENLALATENASAIIISDYNYGVANSEVAELCTKISNEKKIPLLIDSRRRLEEFKNATTATPNQEEVENVLGENFTQSDCVELREKLRLQALLITRGNQGMRLIEKDREVVDLEAVGSKEPVDVTGAGDTVIATYALGLASGLSFEDSAKIANHAGGIVVMKKGTASVSPNELMSSLEKNGS